MRANDDPVCIDLRFQGAEGVIASWLVPTEAGRIIIDCGPATSRIELERGVHAAGLDMREITRIVLTHIHLDHGGATGSLLREYPHLRVTVHRDSADILVDPSRLVRSATFSYGDAMETLWGDILAVDRAQIDPILPGETVPGTSLRAIATPGHTGTHLAYFDSRTGVLFTGDSTHARLQDSAVIVPTLSPVEVDIDAWQTTATRLRQLAPSALALPHFGLVEDAESHLEQIEDRIDSRMAIAAQIVKSPADSAALAEALAAQTRWEFLAEGDDVDTRIATMELCMPSWLGAQGIMRWYKVHNKFRES